MANGSTSLKKTYSGRLPAKLRMKNNEQDILYTSYWDTENARAGLLFLSICAGAFRLLVPGSQESQVAVVAAKG